MNIFPVVFFFFFSLSLSLSGKTGGACPYCELIREKV
jgi:hypothetical protein